MYIGSTQNCCGIASFRGVSQGVDVRWANLLPGLVLRIENAGKYRAGG
jgi:hypothetical protein